jgi:uncharacterized BrkB/YihY/UPF0761 family membrane protein
MRAVSPSPRPSSVTGAIARLRHSAYERWRRLVRQRPELALLEVFVSRWTGVNATVLAGHLAYRVFLFLVPLVLLLVGGLGLAAASGADLEDGSQRFRIGAALASAVAGAGDEASSSHVQLLVFGTIGTLVACFGLLKALQVVFAESWGIEVPKTGRFGLLWRFLFGTVLLLVSLLLRQWLARSNIVFSIGALFVALAINTALIVGLSWMMPRRATRLIDLTPGAVVGGLAFAGLNIAGFLYFPDRVARASALYGSFGLVLVVLFYLFLVGQLLVASAVANSVWFDRDEILHGADQPPT